ncbi:MAG: S24/S26 family peptidase [Actinomycetota bacterium]|nr:S24/S26 family peptidase [Actinomycetota bacterium]
MAVLTRLAEEGHAIEVSGESMLPTLRAGDRIVIMADLEPRLGDVVVFVDAPGRTVVHRLVASVGGSIVCLGDNRATFDTPVPRSQLVGVARATAVGHPHSNLRPTASGWILLAGRC